MPRLITCCLALTLLTGVPALAQDGGSTIIPKREVNEVLLQGLDNLAAGGTVSDIVVRHLEVGEENIGVLLALPRRQSPGSQTSSHNRDLRARGR